MSGFSSLGAVFTISTHPFRPRAALLAIGICSRYAWHPNYRTNRIISVNDHVSLAVGVASPRSFVSQKLKPDFRVPTSSRAGVHNTFCAV